MTSSTAMIEEEENPILDLIHAKVVDEGVEKPGSLESIVAACYRNVTKTDIDPLSMAFYCELATPMLTPEHLFFTTEGQVKTPLGILVGTLDIKVDPAQVRCIVN